MKKNSKNIVKALVVVTSCIASYKIGEAAEARLNENGASDEERAATLVAVTGIGFGIGLIARHICKKIG